MSFSSRGSLFTIYLLLACYAASAQTYRQVQETCGTEEPGVEERLDTDLLLDRAMVDVTALPPVNIHVYIWVIRDGSKGAVSGGAVTDAVKTLNAAFGPNFTFTLSDTREVTDHPEWYRMTSRSNAESNAKIALRQGPQGSLNIWTAYAGKKKDRKTPQGKIIKGRTISGYAKRSRGPLDGVVVIPTNLNSTTIIHEVGHWLGLNHTFGSCNDADGIADTPAERTASFGCNRNRDTCPNDPGRDPVTNYMDYSDCRDHFTAGQRARMVVLAAKRRDVPRF